MRESEAAAPAARWLLIGNSRWHWAAPGLEPDQPLRLWHTPPPAAPVAAAELLGWAAVGAEPAWAKPSGIEPAVPELAGTELSRAPLCPAARLTLADVPLADRPPWLGIDRALVGWAAWRDLGGAVLVADAGTVLSLTRVDGAGRFAGGRLLAGGALQLRAMAEGTQGLPHLALPLEGATGEDQPVEGGEGDPAWPRATAAAMRTGVQRALAAAIAAAAMEARQHDPTCALVLTGGDAAALAPLLPPLLDPVWAPLRSSGSAPVLLRPQLALEALAALRPGPGR